MVLVWFAMLGGCVWISDKEHADRVDADGDGERLYGYKNGQDCDDHDPEIIGTTSFYRDEDGDGYGDDLDRIEACAAPEGYVAQAGDCEDDNVFVSPEAEELCSDGLDNDCDGQTCLPPGRYEIGEERSIGAVGGSRFGQQLDATGDFNGDGAADLLVLASDPAAYVFAGPIESDTLTGAAVARFDLGILDIANAHLLWGDLNADGYEDVVIGCPGCASDDGFERAGMVYGWISPQSGDRTLENAGVVLSGFEGDGQLGAALGVIDDATGDGLPDLLVGASGEGSTSQQYGAWYLVPGPVGLAVNTYDLTPVLGSSSWRLGEGPVLSADFSGTGQSWAVVPAEDRNGSGGLYLLAEPALERLRMEDDCMQVVGTGDASQRFAEAYAVGDVNGDGRDDLAVGAPGQNNVGVVYVFRSLGDETIGFIGEESANVTIVGTYDGGELGAALSMGPDLLDDGDPDIAIGAPGDRGGFQGSVFVFSAPRSGFLDADAADWIFEMNWTGQSFGGVLSGGFDLDGAGGTDLAAGLPDDGLGRVILLGGGGF